MRVRIDAGQSLAEIVPFFPSRPDALSYYANLMARRHGQPLSVNCENCGHRRATREETFTWQAVVNTKQTVLWSFLVSALALAVGVIFTRYHRVRFATRHRFCDLCDGTFRRKRWLAAVLSHFFFALLIVSLLAAVPLSVFLVTMIFLAPDLVLKMALFWLLSLVPLSLSIAGFEFCRRLPIPEALRRIGRFPFTLQHVQRNA